MSSAVADLENNLQAMLALKPPGVSGSKISTLTSLCIANVQVRMMPHCNPAHTIAAPPELSTKKHRQSSCTHMAY